MKSVIKVNLVNKSHHQEPSYATSGSAGVDLRAFIENSLTLKPFERALVNTGIFLEIPSGYEAQVRPRSGLAVKQGITCLNTPGTIDSDYRGEVKVLLVNLSNEDQVIQDGDRIAQLVFAKVEQVNFNVVQQLNETVRGEGGFGHTGIK